MTGPELNCLEEMRVNGQAGWSQAYQHAIDQRDAALAEARSSWDKACWTCVQWGEGLYM